MKENSISMWLLRFTRQQPLYLMIAAGAAGIIWAVTGQAPSVTVTLIYSFLCGNFTLLVLENVRNSLLLAQGLVVLVDLPHSPACHYSRSCDSCHIRCIHFRLASVGPSGAAHFLRGFSSDSMEVSGCRQFDLRRRMSFLLDDQVPSGRPEPSTAAGYQFGSVREGTRRRRASASS